MLECCLVYLCQPGCRFYEWKKEASKKQPYYVHLRPEEGQEEKLLLVAGLSDTWQDAEGSVLDTFTLITTAASPRFSWLHGMWQDDQIAARF